jgi:hypothetical protein
MASVAGCGAAAARGSGSRLLLITIVFVASSCSLLVEPDRQQCAVDDDCRLLGGQMSDAVCMDSVCQPNPMWSCLGTGAWPQPEQRKMTVTFHIGDLVTETPTVGVTARLCHKLDFGCEHPISTLAVSDQYGGLPVQVEAGFDGYVELTPADDHMKGIYFFNPPVDGDRDILLPAVDPDDLNLFAGLAGHMPIPGRGHVMLGSYDCLRRPAEGVSLSSADADDKTAAFYLVKKVPSTKAAATDSSGRGGIINLRQGSVSVSGSLADSRAVATVGLFVRNNTITYTTLIPAPN